VSILKKCHVSSAVMVLALFPVGTWAQQTDPQSIEDEPRPAGFTPFGQGPSLAFQLEKTQINSVSGGASVAYVYTDNVSVSSEDAVGNSGCLVQGHLNLALSRQRLTWGLSLGAGLVANQRSDVQSGKTLNLSLDLSYLLTPRVTIRLNSGVNDTSGALYFASPASSVSATTNPATTGTGVGGANQSATSFVPLTQQTLITSSGAELDYQLGPSAITGVRGTYSNLSYPGSSLDTAFGPLYGNRTYAGQAFYSRQISARQAMGVALQAQKFEVQPSSGDTLTGSVRFSYSAHVAPAVTVFVFVGPEYLRYVDVSGAGASGASYRDERWTSAEGVTLNWQGVQTSLVVSLARQPNEGGGLSAASAVTSQVANIMLRRRIGARQEVDLGFGYGLNDPLNGDPSFWSTSSFVQFQRHLTDATVLRMQYTRQEQVLPVLRNTANANLFSVSLSYDFLRPLGR
jgi:hypothetical protein